MRVAFVGVACVLGLCSCSTQNPAPQTTAEPPAPRRNLKPAQAIGEAKDRVTSSLKNDPESARFTEVSYKSSQPTAQAPAINVVCGMVSAKNANGAYEGPRPFAYLVDRRLVALSDGSGATDNGLTTYQNLCVAGFASR